MNALKIFSSLVVMLLLFPAWGEAAKKSESSSNRPVITLGDKPSTEARRNSQAVGRNADKKGTRLKEGKQKKRDLNAIYILPKGYKDITIKGKAQATKKQAAQLIAANNKQMGIGCSIGEIVDLYWEEAEREGIRPDMALSQALLETGYFNFGGAVEPWQHNFCGLGTIGNGVQGAAFKTPREGVRAHIQHLVAYTSHDLPKTELIDPRYEKAHNLRLEKGLITKWSGLNWTWAMGGEYAEKVINTHQLMLRCQDKEPDSMWMDYKKQQKELEKLYNKKMKEREEAEKKYRKSKSPQETKDRKTIVKKKNRAQKIEKNEV
ncbi:MAG: glucosaminidase domain-containing protein [Acidaminococcaceae bacterium]|nr:glucosaminidase domain-containing protein [Acidaminococcaceae bacterium]MBQ9319694.1 glucosaminidase domain-containing protein [Acidaminococcaceae bacterium]